MTEFFNYFYEVGVWLHDEVWIVFFDTIFNNEDDFFRYSMYLVIFVGIATFLSEVIISFIFSFRLRKPVIFSPFKLKEYQSKYSDTLPIKKLTSRIVRQRFYSRDLSVLADKKLSVVQDKKLFIPNKGIVHPIPYNVLSPKERKLYKLRNFYIPEFRLYSSLILRSFDSEVARSLHSIQEKDFNERFDDSKRFNGLDSRITPRYSDMILLTVCHPVLMARAYTSFNSLKSYYRNYFNFLESNLTDGFNGSFNNFSRAMLFKFVSTYDMNDIKFARGSSSNDEDINDNESSYDLDSWKEHSINHRPVYKRKEQ